MKEKFAERFKYLREEKGISQERLADDLGVSHGIISFWETGKREPKLSNLILIAEYFGVTIDYLAGLED
ncbi:MAG: helix-turn-helix transcriptional regulator [Elusimicrobiaceae bacterium]|nr:helix-turn-helix transcriptional regulator [Elusimicrobiaceae bacterium]